MPLSPTGRVIRTGADQGDPFTDDQAVDVATGEIVAAGSSSVALPEQLVERLNAVPWAADDDAALSIAFQIFEAATVEEVGAELESRSIRKMGIAGEPLRLLSFVLSPSAFVDSPEKCPVVAYVDALKYDDTPITFPIGNWGPIAQLVRYYELGQLRGTEETIVKVKIIEIASKVQGHNPALRFVSL